MTKRSKRLWRRVLAGALCLAAAYGVWIYGQIRKQADLDEARPADCIVVLGAAQYNGRPSPVLRARLDHTIELFNQELASHIITTGGFGPDRKFSEAGTASEYLLKKGIPAGAIEVEARGETTLQSVLSVRKRFLRDGYRSCIVVSDGFHLFRSKALFQYAGIIAYGSPAPESPIEHSPGARFWHSFREVFVYTAFKMGIRV